MDNNCLYCTKNHKLQDLMIEVCKLSVSTLYLLRIKHIPAGVLSHIWVTKKNYLILKKRN